MSKPPILTSEPPPPSQVLWMYPIYCISFILNTIWYQEIADDGTVHGSTILTGSDASSERCICVM